MTWQRIPSLCCILVALALGACNPAAIPTPPVANFATRFPVNLGGKTFRLQIALTELEIKNGLMGRRALAPDEGMLFVFPDNARREFWMRNVPINLALGYFTADGHLDEIRPLIAENPETIPSRSTAIRYVLELSENAFAANALGTGAQLDLAAVRSAIHQRGFRPDAYLPPP
ncbi:MAG: DUF192 domain-containing protein [Puniceicoccales bacterium]|jgi:uncharacterized membrane protein (UPF0127 family)|nr:DUF192 domain-containing protein [Puniceicoccales bacterium]